MTKFVTLIALLALSMLVIVPASAVNEYRDMNPANDVPDMSTYGYAQFYINAGGSAQDLTVYLQNVKQNLTFDSRWNPDRTDIDGQNGGWMKVQILPCGFSEKVLLASGETFEACLRNGNGNQPECKRFIVGGADTTAVVFQGAAVSSLGEEEVVKVCQREILHAEYGERIVVIDEPAHTEYSIFIHDGYYGCKPGEGAFCGEGQHWGWIDTSYWSDWSDSKPYSWNYISDHHKQTREVEAITHADWESGYAVVTDNVREAISKGHLSFVFSNGWLGNYEGGIFDNEQNKYLLSPIDRDPAKDIVKHVSITYKDCYGFEDTVEAEEYQVINLN